MLQPAGAARRRTEEIAFRNGWLSASEFPGRALNDSARRSTAAVCSRIWIERGTRRSTTGCVQKNPPARWSSSANSMDRGTEARPSELAGRCSSREPLGLGSRRVVAAADRFMMDHLDEWGPHVQIPCPPHLEAEIDIIVRDFQVPDRQSPRPLRYAVFRTARQAAVTAR